MNKNTFLAYLIVIIIYIYINNRFANIDKQESFDAISDNAVNNIQAQINNTQTNNTQLKTNEFIETEIQIDDTNSEIKTESEKNIQDERNLNVNTVKLDSGFIFLSSILMFITVIIILCCFSSMFIPSTPQVSQSQQIQSIQPISMGKTDGIKILESSEIPKINIGLLYPPNPYPQTPYPQYVKNTYSYQNPYPNSYPNSYPNPYPYRI